MLPGNVPQRPVDLHGDLWGVTTYFNPENYSSKRINLELFCEGVRRQRLPLLIVELAMNGSRFTVEERLADRVVRLRSDAVLWHKERLLNLGISELPPGCDRVVWLDADILFENQDWVGETGELLRSYPVVQPFREACWLQKGETRPAAGYMFIPGVGEGRSLPGMAYAMARKKDHLKALRNYYQHGHSGFAWAARRELLNRHGLYDGLILGGGDLLIAKTFYTSEELEPAFYPPALNNAVERWRRPFHADVEGSVSHAEGRVLHLWHGQAANRTYVDRARILRDCEFDPECDIEPSPDGPWQWSSAKPEFHRRVREYFESRREDE